MLVYKANVEIGKASRLVFIFLVKEPEILLATGTRKDIHQKQLLSLVAQTCDSNYMGG